MKNVKFSHFFAKSRVSFQNQNYPSKYTTNYKNFGSTTKIRATAAASNVWPENRVFDHFDKNCCSSMRFRGEKLFYCEPLWSRLVVNHKRKQFWNRKIFNVKKGKNVTFLQRVKKVTAVDGSQVLKLFLEKLCKNLQYIQNLEEGFWFLRRNSIFEIFCYSWKSQKRNFSAKS